MLAYAQFLSNVGRPVGEAVQLEHARAGGGCWARNFTRAIVLLNSQPAGAAGPCIGALDLGLRYTDLLGQLVVGSIVVPPASARMLLRWSALEQEGVKEFEQTLQPQHEQEQHEEEQQEQEQEREREQEREQEQEEGQGEQGAAGMRYMSLYDYDPKATHSWINLGAFSIRRSK